MSDAALKGGESSDSPFLFPREKWAEVEERFWAKVARSEGCWDWVSSRLPAGYGQFAIGKGKVGLAHRISFALANGPIPTGFFIDHTCHNASCVRPDHLRAVTPKQNGENRAGAPANSSSGILGVHLLKGSGRWRAQVRHNGRALNLGTFSTKDEAAGVVIAKRNELFTHNDSDRVAA